MEPHTNDQLEPYTHAPNHHCFGCGLQNPKGLHLQFQLAPDDAVVSLPAVSNDFHGPPGYAHGGIIATMLDEAMSKAVRLQGVVAMTRKMDIEYLRPVLTGTPLRLEGRVTRREGRKHWAEAAIWNSEGKILAQAHGLFVEPRPAP